MKSATLVLALVITSATLASAQSLGQLATREAERRKAIQAPAKVITVGDLKPVEPASPSAAPAAPVVAAAPPPSVNQPAEAKYLARDASHWLNRMRELRTRHNRLTLQAAALQNRVDGLTTDIDSTGDRLRRGTIESERQKVRTELSLVKADIAATDHQIFDLEEEARRSNVPPGWLRP